MTAVCWRSGTNMAAHVGRIADSIRAAAAPCPRLRPVLVRTAPCARLVRHCQTPACGPSPAGVLGAHRRHRATFRPGTCGAQALDWPPVITGRQAIPGLRVSEETGTG